MNKFYTIMALIFVFFAVTVSAATVTVVRGTITDGDAVPVDGASVEVTCTHDSTDYVENVITGSDGKYYAFFPVTHCDEGDSVSIHVVKGDFDGSGKGTVSYSQDCRINASLNT